MRDDGSQTESSERGAPTPNPSPQGGGGQECALEPLPLVGRGRGGGASLQTLDSGAKVMTAPYDITAIRADFPILSRTVYGKPLVYLDNGASAQKPQAVIDAITHAYSNEYANVHRGLHFLSNAATDAYENAREIVRKFLNAGKLEEIIFTKSTTEAINAVAYGWGMPNIGADDEIVLTIMEHHSNIVPWHFIRERQGAKLVWVPVDDEGAFHIEDFEKCLTDKTKLVAITQMSNALGTVVPVKEVCRICHARGIKVLVDGSQSAVHMPIDVRDMDCDFFVMTGHKLYGPSGIGVLYGKYDILANMRPFMGGGEMIRDVTMENVTYGEPPHRLEAGTPPIVQAIGLGAALNYMKALAGKTSPRMRRTCATTPMRSCPRSIRCAFSATRREKAPLSRSNCRASTPMTSQWSSTGQGWRFGPARIAPSR